MANQDEKIALQAKKTSRSGDPLQLKQFRAVLIEHLDIEQPCPQIIFEELLTLLHSPKLLKYSEYGTLLGDLAISEFWFSDDQKAKLVDTVGKLFFEMEHSIARMQACHLLLALQARESTAVQFLQLLQKSKSDHRPQSELIWELAALARDDEVSTNTRMMIEQALPKKDGTA